MHQHRREVHYSIIVPTRGAHSFTNLPAFLLAGSLVIILLALSACNMPRKGATKTVSAAGMIYTAAAQTLEAELYAATATGAVITSTPISSPTPQASNTPAPTESDETEEEDDVYDYDYEEQPPLPPPPPTAIPCDHATYIKDVSYPDNTELAAGTAFTKVWRIKNTGACTWSEDYAVVFMDGDDMDTPSSVSMPHTVRPGETVDISVDLIAPSAPGTYRAEYKLRSDTNHVFGLGGVDKPFWVQIKVTAATGLLLDFLIDADEADWSSGLGSPPGNDLAFNGAEDSSEGVAKIVDGVKLEDGATSGKVLLMVPKRENNGYIMGVFDEYVVQKGDHFKARLGFMQVADTCSGGDVYFQLAYKDSDGYHLIKEWNQTCDGSQTPVDVNLTDFKGRSIQFALLITANGDPTNDWAIWNSPRIEHP